MLDFLYIASFAAAFLFDGIMLYNSIASYCFFVASFFVFAVAIYRYWKCPAKLNNLHRLTWKSKLCFAITYSCALLLSGAIGWRQLIYAKHPMLFHIVHSTTWIVWGIFFILTDNARLSNREGHNQ